MPRNRREGMLWLTIPLGAVLVRAGLDSTASTDSSPTSVAPEPPLGEPFDADEVCLLQGLVSPSPKAVAGHVAPPRVPSIAELRDWESRVRHHASQRPASLAQATDVHDRRPLEWWRVPQHPGPAASAVQPSRHASRGTQLQMTATLLGNERKMSLVDKAGNRMFQREFSELLRANAELQQTLRLARLAGTSTATNRNATNTTGTNWLPFTPPAWVEPAVFFTLLGLAACCCCACFGLCCFRQYKVGQAAEMGQYIPSLREEASQVGDDCCNFLKGCNFLVVTALIFLLFLFFLGMAALWKIGIVQQWSSFLALEGPTVALMMCLFAAILYTWSTQQKIMNYDTAEQVREVAAGVEFLATADMRAAQAKAAKPSGGFPGSACCGRPATKEPNTAYGPPRDPAMYTAQNQPPYPPPNQPPYPPPY